MTWVPREGREEEITFTLEDGSLEGIMEEVTFTTN